MLIPSRRTLTQRAAAVRQSAALMAAIDRGDVHLPGPPPPKPPSPTMRLLVAHERWLQAWARVQPTPTYDALVVELGVDPALIGLRR